MSTHRNRRGAGSPSRNGHAPAKPDPHPDDIPAPPAAEPLLRDFCRHLAGEFLRAREFHERYLALGDAGRAPVLDDLFGDHLGDAERRALAAIWTLNGQNTSVIGDLGGFQAERDVAEFEVEAHAFRAIGKAPGPKGRRARLEVSPVLALRPDPVPDPPPRPGPAVYALRSEVTGKRLDWTYLEARPEAMRVCLFAVRQWQRAVRRLDRHTDLYARSDAAKGIPYESDTPALDECREWERWLNTLATIAGAAKRQLIGCVLLNGRVVSRVEDDPPGTDWTPVALHVGSDHYVVAPADDGTGRAVLAVVSFANFDSRDFGISGGN